MIQKAKTITIAAFCIAATAVIANADTFNVQAGKTTKLTALGTYSLETCQVLAPPKYRLTQPENGTFKVVRGTVKLTRTRCKGKTIPTLWLTYTPNRGFRGQDRGAYAYESYTHLDQVAPSWFNERVILNVQ